MKTTVVLPNDLFLLAEDEAKSLGLSRNRLYAFALADFLGRRRAGWISERFNKVHGRRRASVDPAVDRAQVKALPEESW
jgi:hypothetical protein